MRRYVLIGVAGLVAVVIGIVLWVVLPSKEEQPEPEYNWTTTYHTTTTTRYDPDGQGWTPGFY